MRMIRTWLAATAVLLSLLSTAVLAQSIDHGAYLDLDGDPSTGCNIVTAAGTVSGVEVRLVATVSGQPPQVVVTSRATCVGASFGPAVTQPGGYPVGLDLGIGGSDVIEFGAALADLGDGGPAGLTFVSTSATGADLALSAGIVLPGGGTDPDADVPTIIPATGAFALLLLIGLALWFARNHPGLRSSLALLLLLGVGVVWAAGFVQDGQVGDWIGESPIGTDPSNDATGNEAANDIVAVFARTEAGRLHLRVDVRDAQDAPTSAPVATAQSVTVAEDDTIDIVLRGTDADDDALSFAIDTPPTRGTLSAITPIDDTSARVSYTGTTDLDGADSFTFTVSDGSETSAAATVSITVTPVNDAPVVAAQALDVVENAPNATVVGTATATDADTDQTLNWAITGGNTGNAFAIDAASGVITVADTGAVIPANTPFLLTVQATDDGTPPLADSDTITIAVTGINDAPSFTAGAAQTVDEDAAATSVTNWATAISAGPADEAGQTLTFIVANDNAALFAVQPAVDAGGTLSFEPAADANGVATLSVSLQDDGGTVGGGVDTSAVQTVAITVNAVNDVPVFVAGAAQTVPQDAGAQTVDPWATGIGAGAANENAQVLAFAITGNSNAALFAVAPAISPTGVLTYTPAAGAVGSATITLTLSDDGGGTDTSAPQSFTIDISDVNDAPTFVLGALPAAALEDAGAQTVAGFASTIDDGDPTAVQALTFDVVGNSNAALFSVAPAIDAITGDLTYSAAPDAVGNADITVVLRDDGGTALGGVDTSAPQTFTLAIAPVNDAPSFVGGTSAAALENAGAQTIVGFHTAVSAGPPDEAGQAVAFTTTVTGTTGTLVFATAPAVAPDGTLTFAAQNGTIGSATVSSVLSDDGGVADGGVDASAPQTFVITISNVNDPPVFALGGTQTALEDAGMQTVAGFASGIDDGDGGTQTVSFNITNNTNAALFSAGPAIDAAGTLTWTPVADANGTATISVEAQDDGGTADGGDDTSAPQTFVIDIVAVNDAPGFTGGTTAAVLESAGPATFANFHTAVSAGPADEAGQTLSFNTTVGATTGSLTFSTAPALSPTGTLTFTATNGTFGTATVSTTLSDDGGTANGGVDTSAVQTFTITVNNVNDPPVFTVGGSQAAFEDAGPQTVAGFVTGIADGDDGTQTVAFDITNNTNAALFDAGPAIAANGTLTWTPAANANGTATITVRAQDNGGTANGGNDTSPPQTFVIDVTAINDAPSFTPGTNPSVNEDSGPASIAWATAISSGPADESGQSFGFNVAVVSGGMLFSALPTVSVGGQLLFTPAPNASGTATFTVTLQDNGGTANGGSDTSAPATLTITIDAVDDAPVAVNDAASVIEDAAATAVNVLANDTDIDGGPISIAAVTQPLNGTVVVTGGGTGLSYQPNPNYCNAPPGTTPDTFTYTLAPGSAIGTVQMTVTCVDDNPVAVNDAITITEDDPATAIPVLANDTDVDGGPKSVVSVTQPANGIVVVTGGGSGLTYLPNPNYCNTPTPGTPDTFTYTLTPGGSSATVGVSVTCVVDNPVAVNDTASVNEDAAASPIDVLGNDANPDGSPISVGSITQPANGVVVVTGGGTGLTYQPNPNYCNAPPGTTPDIFTYTIVPGGSVGTVYITVSCVDDPPVAVADAATVLEDASATAINVQANDIDVDGGAKTIDSTTQPTNGDVVITGGGTGLTYQPDANYCNDPPGTTLDTFTYTLMPGGSIATVSVTVTCVNDPPIVPAVPNIPVHTHIAVGIADGATGDLLIPGAIIDPDSNSFSIGTAPAGSANGGELAINTATGAFTYNPPGGFTGTDSFQYTICDNGSPSACVIVPVNLVVSGPRIFFVDDDAVVSGTRDGTQQQPLQTLTAAAGVATTSGDRIFLHSGTYTTGVTLANGVELAGQGLDAVTVNDFDPEFGITPPSNSIARPLVDQTPPVITNAAGNGITLGSNNTVRGVQIGNVTGAAIAGNGFGTLRVYDDVRINTNGQGIVLNNGTFDATSTIAVLTSSGGVNNVSLTTVNGTVGLGTGSLSGATGTAFAVIGGSAGITYAGSINKTSAGLLIDVQNKATGTIALSGALGATTGNGISLSNLDGTLNATGVVTLNGGDAGIDVTTNSAGTINFSNTGSSITNPVNEAITIDSSSPTFTYAGTVSKTNTGTGIRLSNNTGGTQTFAGALTLSSAAANAIDLSANGATTMNFSGAVALTSTLGDGIRHQTSGTVNFSGGLAISSASGDGIDATGGGTLTVTAPGAVVNTILTTGTGVSLNMVNAQIGAGGLTFRSITNNGTGANGVNLSNTGTAAGNGGLTVTGVGTTNNSGGTINNKTVRGIATNGLKSLSLSNMGFTGNGTDQDGPATCGDALNATNTNCGAAIHLLSTSAVSLSNVDVSGGAQMGINGNDVNGLTMNDVTVQNAGNDVFEDGVQLVNLRGTANITNSSFTGNFHRQFEVQNRNAASALTLTINNTTFDRGTYVSTSGQNVLIAGHGTSQPMATTITNSTFRRSFGSAITAQGVDNAAMTFNIGTVGNPNTFTDNSLAMQFLTDNAATMNATVTNNTVTVTGTVTSGATPITFRKGTNATGLYIGSFTGNTIGNATVASGANCAGCNGVSITNEGASGGMRMTVSNNTIQHIPQRGVEFLGQANDTVGVVVTNNQFASPDGVPGTRIGHAIFMQSGTSDDDGSQLCAEIQGNTILPNPGFWDGITSGNIRLRINPAESGAPISNFRLRNVGGSGSPADAVNYLNGANTNGLASATTNAIVPNYTTGTGACF